MEHIGKLLRFLCIENQGLPILHGLCYFIYNREVPAFWGCLDNVTLAQFIPVRYLFILFLL